MGFTLPFMSTKDYLAYAVFSMVAVCCFFAGKAAFGFLGSIVGMWLGSMAGFAAFRVIPRRRLRFGVSVLGLVTVLGLTGLYGAVRLSTRVVTITMAHLKGRWVADDHGRPVSLDIGNSSAVLDMVMLLKPLRFNLVLQQDSLLMTSPTQLKLAWRIYTLTETQMTVGAEAAEEADDIVLDFQRADD